MADLPDPDRYLENVLVHADPAALDRCRPCPPSLDGLVAAPGVGARHRRARQDQRGARLGDDEIGSWFGAPVRAVPRSRVDVARHDRRDGIAVADAAVREHLVSSRELEIPART